MFERLPRNLGQGIVIAAALLLAGCPAASNSNPAAETAPPAPRAAVPLRLAVVDDPALAAAVRRLQGEWEARSGGALEVAALTSDELWRAERIDADAVIYPSLYLGELAERGWIVPVRAALVEQEGYAGDEVFSLLARIETAWDGQPYALPLGSPLLVLYYRADWLEKLGRQPPRTWAEYQELVKRFAERPMSDESTADDAAVDKVAWSATIEPLAEGWASRMLLTRAAAYIRHRNHYSTFFHIDTFEPLIAGPGFVRALEELVAAHAEGTPLTDPAGARRAFHAGEAAMAISWPTAAEPRDAADLAEGRVGIAELPGAAKVYDIAGGEWESRVEGETSRVPLLGVAGRLASVTGATKNVAAAQRLLAWLAGPEISAELAPASGAATLFRHSHAARPASWVESQLDAQAARQYADTLSAALDREAHLNLPRLPGGARYMAALDVAVHRALAGEATPQAALDAAAQTWREITAELGETPQHAAYRRSLGLSSAPADPR